MLPYLSILGQNIAIFVFFPKKKGKSKVNQKVPVGQFPLTEFILAFWFLTHNVPGEVKREFESIF